MSFTGKRIYISVLTLLIVFISYGQEVQFTAESGEVQSSSGHTKLEWTQGDGGPYELQYATDDAFSDAKIVYSGLDRASFISGLPEGKHHYRIRGENSPWSAPLIVNVQYQSMQLAFSLFGTGAVVFLLTVLVVVKGAREKEIQS